MKDIDWIALLTFAAFWMISREIEAQKRRVEEAEKRAIDRDAKTRAVLLERIDTLEATIDTLEATLGQQREMDVEDPFF